MDTAQTPKIRYSIIQGWKTAAVCTPSRRPPLLVSSLQHTFAPVLARSEAFLSIHPHSSRHLQRRARHWKDGSLDVRCIRLCDVLRTQPEYPGRVHCLRLSPKVTIPVIPSVLFRRTDQVDSR